MGVSLHVGLLGKSLLAHEYLGEVEEVLPEGDGGRPACRNSVVLSDWPTLLHHSLEVVVEPLVLAGIVDRNIHLVVDLPAPPVIVHRAQVDEPPVREVYLRVQQPFLGLVHLDSPQDQPLEEHVVEDVPKHRLVPLSRCQNSCLASLSHSLPHRSIKFYHRVMVRLNYFDLLLRVIHHFQYALLDLVALH